MSKTGDGVLLPHGGYRKLLSYKVAEAVYDATVVFCNRFIDKRSRTHDQMVQAARSGVRNISEGSGAAATSSKTEMTLTNVARASLSDELIRDYRSFLIQNGLRVWDKNSKEALAARTRLRQDAHPPAQTAEPEQLTGLGALPAFVAVAGPEEAANVMLCAVNQAAYLLRRQMESQSRVFLEQGGFAERLYALRKEKRESDRSDQSDRSDKSDVAPRPTCPLCGKPMRRRTARQGTHSGKPFWGCSGYPACAGIVPA